MQKFVATESTGDGAAIPEATGSSPASSSTGIPRIGTPVSRNGTASNATARASPASSISSPTDGPTAGASATSLLGGGVFPLFWAAAVAVIV